MDPISDSLQELLEGGVVATVGVRHPERGPQVCRAWGLRLSDRNAQRLDLFFDQEPARLVLEALDSDSRLALVIADPVSFYSLQFKGKCTVAGKPTRADVDWIQRHRDLVMANLALVGEGPTTSRNFWTTKLTKATLAIEAAFDQTPGPNAGRPL